MMAVPKKGLLKGKRKTFVLIQCVYLVYVVCMCHGELLVDSAGATGGLLSPWLAGRYSIFADGSVASVASVSTAKLSF